MDGFVEFRYRDGIIPTRTRSTVKQIKVLTLQNFIVENALILCIKQDIFSPYFLNQSEETVPSNAPTQNSTHEDSSS